MQFSLSLLLSLASLAFASTHSSASALSPSHTVTNNGHWYVIYNRTVSASGYQYEHVNSTYHNSKLPNHGKPVNVICTYTYIPEQNPPYTSRSCSQKGFSYEWDGYDMNLNQTVLLNGKKVKVEGSGHLDETYVGGAGESFGNQGKVEVSKVVPA